MNQQFEIKPSAQIAISISIVHLFAGFSVIYFDVTIDMKSALLILVLASVTWQLNRWRKSGLFANYESQSDCWKLSLDNQHWQYYETIKTAYLNGSLVWIIFSAPGQRTRSVIIGVDSMPAERFLQLRRCILCPAMYS